MAIKIICIIQRAICTIDAVIFSVSNPEKTIQWLAKSVPLAFRNRNEDFRTLIWIPVGLRSGFLTLLYEYVNSTGQKEIGSASIPKNRVKKNYTFITAIKCKSPDNTTFIMAFTYKLNAIRMNI